MKNLVLSLLGVVILVAGCKKAKQITQINTNITYEQVLPLTAIDTTLAGITLPPGGIGINFPRMGVPSNSQQFLADYNTSAEKIISAKMKQLVLSQDNSTANFDYADSIMVYISGNSLPDTLIAFAYNIPKGRSTIEMTPVDKNLKQYFLQDSFYFREYVRFNAIPKSGSNVSIRSVWNLIANPLN
jgi:hypothetical protein